MILGEFWDDPGRVLGCSWESFAQTARAPSGQSTNDPATFGNNDDDDVDDDAETQVGPRKRGPRKLHWGPSSPLAICWDDVSASTA